MPPSATLTHARRFDAAVTELTQANALAPWRLDALLLLAEAHVGRWQAEKRAQDAIVGRAHARALLDRDPEAPRAFELLNILDANEPAMPSAGGSPPTSKPTKRAPVVALALVAVLFVIGGTVMLLGKTAPMEEAVEAEAVLHQLGVVTPETTKQTSTSGDPAALPAGTARPPCRQPCRLPPPPRPRPRRRGRAGAGLSRRLSAATRRHRRHVDNKDAHLATGARKHT